MNKFLENLPYFGLGVFVPLFCIPLLVDPHQDAKWLLVGCVALLLCIRQFANATMNQSFILKNQKLIVLILVPMISQFLLSMVLHWRGFASSQVLEWSCWIVLVEAFRTSSYGPKEEFDLFKKSFIIGLFGLLSFAVFAEILKHFLPQDHFIWLEPFLYPDFTLGYPNFAAHFFAISLIVFWHAIQSKRSTSIRLQWRLIFAISICTILLVTLRSRAAIFGIAISLMGSEIILQWKKRQFYIKKAALKVAAIASFVGIIILIYQISLTPDLQILKRGNTKLRLARWSNTVSITTHNPWFGIGPGMFEFSYPRYGARLGGDYEIDEHDTIRSPHNGYLELAVEQGIPALMLFLIGIFGIFRTFQYDDPIRKLALGIFLFLLTDASVAFPMEIPFTFFCSAFVLGVALRPIKPTSSGLFIQKRLLYRFALVVAFFLIGFLNFRRGQSVFYEAFSQNPEKLTEKCLNYPDHWNTCIKSAQLLRKDGKVDEGESLLNKLLHWFPTALPLERELILTQIADGRWKTACRETKRYCETFPRGCQFESFYNSFCK